MNPNRELTDEALLAQAAAYSFVGSLSELTSPSLLEISQTCGIDFATALLYDRLKKSASPVRPVANFNDENALSLSTKHQLGLIAIVPGAFYQETKKFNADGGPILKFLQAQRLPHKIIPVESFGALDQNGQIICQWLRQNATPNTVLVSLSKGGADLKWALQSDPQAFANVAAWINLSGICEGTPLVTWLLGRRYRSLLVRPLFRWRSYKFDVVSQLESGPAKPLNCEWNLPAHLTVLHVLGFPRQAHLTTRLARRGHRRLASYGPNDGAGIVLHDAIRRPGAIYPVWGADHFLNKTPSSLVTVFQNSLAWLTQSANAIQPEPFIPEVV